MACSNVDDHEVKRAEGADSMVLWCWRTAGGVNFATWQTRDVASADADSVDGCYR